MKYNILPQRDIRSPTSEDSENEKLHLPQGRVSVPVTALLVLSSTTLIAVLSLVLMLTVGGGSQCQIKDNGWNVTRPYGRENTSRMSIDHDNDHLWKIFEGPQTFGLMSKDNPDTAGMISMFHQMNCLALLRQEIQSAREGRDVDSSEKEMLHWSHCFDYLYQTLRCYADDTDEWEIFTMPRTKHITGMDTMRTCRDPSQLVKRACEARETQLEMGWTDAPLPSMCETGELPW